MYIRLRLRESLQVEFVIPLYDPAEDDVRSILMDVCRAIERNADFYVSGFGQDEWPVDVGTDLPILLEQLPSALHAVRHGVATDIDFYEQGLERTIALEPSGKGYVAKCISRTNWHPQFDSEEVELGELESMLLGVQEEFLRILAILAPALLEHPWVREWENESQFTKYV